MSDALPTPKLMIERHRNSRVGWLRASVLGANDGILSTAGLIVGVAAASVERSEILITAVAGLVAGALSMAAGEYVSVSSQADTEKADLSRERKELDTNVEFERAELASLYVQRGLDETLAKEVARQLMDYDALGAHARDELNISEGTVARPVQAALTSAVSFTLGGAFPLLLVLAFPRGLLGASVAIGSMAFLASLGAVAAYSGGAGVWRGAVRCAAWGAIVMGATAGVGALIGRAV